MFRSPVLFSIFCVLFSFNLHAETSEVSSDSRLLFFCFDKIVPTNYYIIEQTKLDDGRMVDPNASDTSSRPKGEIKFIKYSKEGASLFEVLTKGELKRSSDGEFYRNSHRFYNFKKRNNEILLGFSYDRKEPDIPYIFWESKTEEEWDDGAALDCGEEVLVSNFSTDEMIENNTWVDPVPLVVEN